MSTSPATKADLNALGDNLRASMRDNTREILQYVQESQAAQNKRLDDLSEDVSKIKSAVVDLLATDRHLHNLVRELKRQNITLDETKIFAA